MTKKSKVVNIIELMENRHIRGLPKAISIIENDEEGRDEILDYAFRKGSNSGIVLGFTGPPGAGKSTLLCSIIRQYRLVGKKVGVIAVDPTSPYSGGAVLGDRIRMQEHNADPGVYIRSLASRKAHGGLSDVTKYVLYLYRAFGFDVILLETLGVGQDEIDVTKYADITAVLLIPGYGDSIQLLKAGIMEIADVFIINKSDKIGADTLKKQLENIIYVMDENRRPLIVNTIADQNVGITETIEALEKVNQRNLGQKELKYRQRISAEIRSSVSYRYEKEVDRHIEEMVEKVLKATMTPIEASKEILKRLVF